MATEDITYNQASGKLYQGGAPYLNRIFIDEAEAENYLKQVGLCLGSSAIQSKFPKYIQKQELVS